MKQLHAVVWKENNLFVAKALEVEVTSQGNSEISALKNLQEALELYFEDGDTDNIISIQEPKMQGISINLHT